MAGDRSVVCYKTNATIIIIHFGELFIPELQCSHL